MSELLSLLQGLPESGDAVLVIGHNPGVEDLAVCLSGAPVPEAKPGKRLTTGNFLHLHCPAGVKPASCRLTALQRPRDLR